MHNNVVFKQIQYTKLILNKSKNALAWRLRTQLAERFCLQLKDTQANKMHHELEDIRRSFEIYYKFYIHNPSLQ